MRLIELHILQSFPVTCLNRDDVGSPKSAIFGGVQRGRVSSQALKRAARMAARQHDQLGNLFSGIRSRLIIEPFAEALVACGQQEDQAKEQAQKIAEALSKIDKKSANQVTTAVYLSPNEIEQIAKAVAAGEDPAKAAKKANRLDAADIALFGRMIANDSTLTIEGAAMFSHALSTHKTVNEIDFFSAVDDRKADAGDAEDAGAGMIGTLEYNSSTYYRYVAINLDLLFDQQHLGGIEDQTQRKQILATFIEAVLTSVPSARQNSMNGATLPSEVLAIRKDKGQPIQLVNAFESPVKAEHGGGYTKPSVKEMQQHYETLKKHWNIESTVETLLSNDGLNTLIAKLLKDNV